MSFMTTFLIDHGAFPHKMLAGRKIFLDEALEKDMNMLDELKCMPRTVDFVCHLLDHASDIKAICLTPSWRFTK